MALLFYFFPQNDRALFYAEMLVSNLSNSRVLLAVRPLQPAISAIFHSKNRFLLGNRCTALSSAEESTDANIFGHSAHGETDLRRASVSIRSIRTPEQRDRAGRGAAGDQRHHWLKEPFASYRSAAKYFSQVVCQQSAGRYFTVRSSALVCAFKFFLPYSPIINAFDSSSTGRPTRR